MASSAATATTSTEASITVASKVPFAELCKTLEKIRSSKARPEKERHFKEFLGAWRKFHNALHHGGDAGTTTTTTDSFYPAMRLVLPQLERERVAYGVKESALAKLYIEVLGLPRDGKDAARLLNYRAPVGGAQRGDAGDFASVAYFVLRPRCSAGGTLTVEEVNRQLDALASGNASKSKERVKTSLLTLLGSTSALEQKWLIRMVLKEMKMGLSQQSILDLFHADAADLYGVTVDLHKVCRQLHDPAASCDDVQSVRLFSAFKPMLGAVGKMDRVERLMSHQPFYVETKLDGERMQLHRDGDVYRYFSRNGFEYTAQFGGAPTEGSLTRFVHAAFAPHVSSVILDGEMMGYNARSSTFVTKGGRFDVKHLGADADSPLQACFCVFDVLLLNGQRLTGEPLRRRDELLRETFAPVEGRLRAVEKREIRTRGDVADALNDAIDSREEGIMIKDPASVYKPDKRGYGWYKIKPEYMGDLMDELDLLIVGGYWGKGRRGGMMSHFLCAVAEVAEDGERPAVFHTLCRVGSGYTMQELYDLGLKLAPHWRPYRRKDPPGCILCATEKPEVYLEPCNAVVVQVRAAEIVASDQYRTGCTLRFPRIERIRDDKAWHECLTLAGLRALRAAGRLTKRHVDAAATADGDGDSDKKRRRRAAATAAGPGSRRTIAVQERFRAQDLSGVERKSELFQDVEVCVMGGTAEHPKAQLERRVAECGGFIVQNPGLDTYCVLVDVLTARVRNVIGASKHDVIRAGWLVECLERGSLVPWQPRHVVHLTEETKQEYTKEFDEHGDSYFSPTDDAQLREVFGRMAERGKGKPVPACTIADIEERYGWAGHPAVLFRRCVFYLDMYTEVGDPSTALANCSLELLGLRLRARGAVLTSSPTAGVAVSHVLSLADDAGRLGRIKAARRRLAGKLFRVVHADWATESLRAGRLVDEQEYLL
uniref:DNA ligase n=1 Tax=Petromyzon marinus TaxID=7757 RepID=A0AAJ7XAX9_PETMA|nr:DNA ligase 4 isoform X1 [Petromyzon marinus]XP_032827722.1 DNA ligase 4 isoform X1 [Petromyzon marinus]